MLLIGTTDIRFGGNPSRAHAEKREIKYLLDETNRFFPASQARPGVIFFIVIPAFGRCREERQRLQVISPGGTSSNIIVGWRPDFYSVIGGKLTTYRHLAEEVTDRVGRRLNGVKGTLCYRNPRRCPALRKIRKPSISN